jgi:hypothetical protein
MVMVLAPKKKGAPVPTTKAKAEPKAEKPKKVAAAKPAAA